MIIKLFTLTTVWFYDISKGILRLNTHLSIMFERIEINQEKLGGKPIIKGTRIPVHLILGMLAEEMSTQEILEEYPELNDKDIREAIKYASYLLSREESHEVPA